MIANSYKCIQLVGVVVMYIHDPLGKQSSIRCAKYSSKNAPKQRSQLRLLLHNLHPQLRHPFNNLLSLSLNIPHQILHRRTIMNQPNTLPRSPNPIIGITNLINDFSSHSRNEMAYVFELGSARALFEGDDFLCDCILVDASCVVKCSEDVYRVLFRRCDYLVFDILMNRAEIEVRSDEGIEFLYMEQTSRRYT